MKELNNPICHKYLKKIIYKYKTIKLANFIFCVVILIFIATLLKFTSDGSRTADHLFKVRTLFTMWVATLFTDSRRTCFITIPQKWGVNFSQVILISG
jgi:hypothetical protein